MILYILDANFRRVNTLDTFVSAIWTDRYSKAGDFTLVVEASVAMIDLLSEATYVARAGTKEVMIIDTQSIEDGLLTVTGTSLLGFLEERIIWTDDISDLQNKVTMVFNRKPGDLIARVVDLAAITPTRYVDNLTGLKFGVIDTSGANISSFAIPFGPALATVESLAETYALGVSLYLESADPLGSPVDPAKIDNAGTPYFYDLRFKVYKGVDHSNPINGPIVRFSPALDSLTKVKELRSIKGYKTVGIAVAPNRSTNPTDMFIWYGTAYDDAYFQVGFPRRTMLITMDDLTLDSIGAVDPANPTADEITTMYNTMSERAKNIMINNNYTRVVDGEVVPQNQYVYGASYNLGDIVQLQGYSGVVQKARVTEYIHSQDATGERAYPTISAIE